ncbi:hypothetical protein HDU96_006292 [Phlyctochytrium bullatum]|nr:hypothetical protein HDU96_006292 [Phlyctochytrium bullatum]
MSSNSLADDDLAPTSTTGYKVGVKKTAEELAKMDAEDESLRKWKESLGLKVGSGGGEDIERLKDQQLTIKEGVEYRLKVRFRVNHDVVSGLKYLHAVKRGGIRSA